MSAKKDIETTDPPKRELTEAQRQNWLKCLEKRRENMARRAMEKMKAVEESQALSKKKRDVINNVRRRIKKDALPDPDDIIIPTEKRPRSQDPWQDREDAIVNRIIEAVRPQTPPPPSSPPEPESPPTPSAPPNAASPPLSPVPIRARVRRPYVRKKPAPQSKEPKLERPCYPPAPTPPSTMIRWV